LTPRNGFPASTSGCKLEADIERLLQVVRLAGIERLVAELDPAAIARRSGKRRALLRRERLGKEVARHGEHGVHQRGRDAVPDDVEEPALAAGGADRCRDIRGSSGAPDQRAYIDDGDFGHSDSLGEHHRNGKRRAIVGSNWPRQGGQLMARTLLSRDRTQN